MSDVVIRVYNPHLGKPQSGSFYDIAIDQSDTSIKLDISVKENKNLESLFGIGSQEFSIPSTLENDEFFEYAYDISSDKAGVLMKKIFNASLMVDGMELFNGKLYINDITTDQKGKTYYKCSFNDDVIGLFDYFKDTLIADLDWSDYTHTFNVASILSSWNNNLYNGDIIYPNVFYGYADGEENEAQYTQDSSANSIFNNGVLKSNNFKPAVRIKTIINKIFSSSIYDYTSSFIQHDTNPFNDPTKTFNDLYMLYGENDTKGIVDNTPYSLGIQQSTPTTLATPEFKDIFDVVLFEEGLDYNPTTGLFTALVGGTYTFNLNASIQNNNSYGILLHIEDGSVLSETSQPIPASTTTQYNISWTKTLAIGDSVGYQFGIGFPSGVSGANIDISKSVLVAENSAPELTTTDIGLQFGKLKVVDFLKGLQQMFNLVFYKDKNKPNVINIEPYNDWLDKGNKIDWSNKFDESVDITILHPSTEQPKNINFSLEDDDDASNIYTKGIYGQTFGSFKYIANNDYSDGDKKVGSFFAPTMVSPLEGTTQYTESEVMVIPQIYKNDNNIKRPTKFKPRILFNNGKFTLNDSYNISDGFGNNIPTNDYLRVSPVSNWSNNPKYNLDFADQGYWYGANLISGYGHWTENNTFNKYWARYINQLYRNPARKLTCNITFKPTDLFNLNLNDLIFIKGQLYRINKIKGFNLLKEESIEVELLLDLGPYINKPIFNIGSNGDIINPPQDPSPTDITDDIEFTFDINPSTPTIVIPTDISSSNPLNINVPQGLITQNGFGQTPAGDIIAQLPNGRNNLTIQYNPVLKNNNVVRYDSNTLEVLGSNNVILGSSSISLKGNNNSTDPNSSNVYVMGNNNDIQESNNNVVLGSKYLISSSNDTLYLGGNGFQNIGFDKSVILNTHQNLNASNYPVNPLVYIGSHYSMGAQFVKSTPITGTGGTEVWLTGSNHINTFLYDIDFIRITTGTITIYLPDPIGDGRDASINIGQDRLLRFITNNSIDNTHDITFRVVNNKTIDGQLTYNIDRAYEGIMFYGHNNGWNIIQKKA